MFALLRFIKLFYVISSIIVVSSVLMAAFLVNLLYDFVVKGLFDSHCSKSLKKV